MRIWEKYLNMTQPDKAKIWAILGAIADATIILVLVLSLFWHSCEICYTTNSISGVVKSCAQTTDIFKHGVPSDMLSVFKIEPTPNDTVAGRSIYVNP